MEDQKKLNRETFLQEAEKKLELVRTKLAELHGEPPCMYAIDTITLRSWPESKQTEALSHLHDIALQAESILQQAQQERTVLWEQSDATTADCPLPPIVQMKQIREDLEAYEEAFNFIRLHH